MLFFLNGNMLMITSARKLKVFKVEHIPILIYKHLSKFFNKVINLYARGGFIIRVMLVYMYF